MNVLFLSPTFYPHKGGAESLFEDIATLLVERGHRVTVLAEADETLEPCSRRRGVEVCRIQYPRMRRGRWALGAYLRETAILLAGDYRLLRDRRIATVCIARVDEKCRIFLALKCLRLFRLVVYLHGGELRRFSRESARFRGVLRWALRLCDEAIAVSDELKNEAIRFLPSVARKIRVIPNGVDATTVRNQPAFRRPRKYILFAGRLEPVKNAKAAVGAFIQVCAERHDVDLLLAGTGSQIQEISRLVDERGLSDRIQLLGSVEREQVYALMKGAEFVVLPSLAEGHPLVVIEALMSGRMVLGSDVKGIHDVIVDGTNGALFDPLDQDELARLMLKYLSDGQALAHLEANIAAADLTRYDIRSGIGQHLDAFSEGGGRRKERAAAR